MNKEDISYPIIEALNHYQKSFIHEKNPFFLEDSTRFHRFLDFVNQNASCFDRKLSLGHVTGSGFVLSPDYEAVLMTHHKKLNKWLQLGGHADGESSIHEVALRECLEESGLKNLKFLHLSNEEKIPSIMDLDIHLIQGSKEPDHWHFDVRYLLVSETMDIKISDESMDLKWIPLKNLLSFNSERAIYRPLCKILDYISKK